MGAHRQYAVVGQPHSVGSNWFGIVLGHREGIENVWRGAHPEAIGSTPFLRNWANSMPSKSPLWLCTGPTRSQRWHSSRQLWAIQEAIGSGWCKGQPHAIGSA